MVDNMDKRVQHAQTNFSRSFSTEGRWWQNAGCGKARLATQCLHLSSTLCTKSRQPSHAVEVKSSSQRGDTSLDILSSPGSYKEVWKQVCFGKGLHIYVIYVKKVRIFSSTIIPSPSLHKSCQTNSKRRRYPPSSYTHQNEVLSLLRCWITPS